MTKYLKDVTLVAIDCVNLERVFRAVDICTWQCKFADVMVLSSLKTRNRKVIEIEPIKSLAEYSNFMIDRIDLYIETPYMLIVQWDGYILNAYAWDDVFLDYDYIGASWQHHTNPKPRYLVGNGGFSLRSKLLYHNIKKLGIKANNKAEDITICVDNRIELEAAGVKFADIETANRFSIEGGKYDGQFGFHGEITDIGDKDYV